MIPTLMRIQEILETLNKAPDSANFFYTEEIKKFFNTQFFGSCMRHFLNKNNYLDDNCQLMANRILGEFSMYFANTLGEDCLEIAQTMRMIFNPEHNYYKRNDTVIESHAPVSHQLFTN